VQFTFLIGGTVIIERLFSYEGLGNMAIDAVINRDLPLIQGIVILFALIFTVVNLVVDMTYAALNPRLGMRDARAALHRPPPSVRGSGCRAGGSRCWRSVRSSRRFFARTTRWRRT
jgi:hypothetical protein